MVLFAEKIHKMGPPFSNGRSLGLFHPYKWWGGNKNTPTSSLCAFFLKGKSRAVAKSFASTGSSQKYDDGRHGLRRRHLQCLDQCMWKGPAVEKGRGVWGRGDVLGNQNWLLAVWCFFVIQKSLWPICFTVLFHAKLVDGWDDGTFWQIYLGMKTAFL